MKKFIKITAIFSSMFLLAACVANYTKKNQEVIKEIHESNSEISKINAHIISEFYTAFKNKDAEKMVSFYHDEVEFEDPAFGTLKGNQAKNMWRMLLKIGKDLSINFNQVKANETLGSAYWEADYSFSATGNKVHNKVTAMFEFKDGKIYRHKDHFDLWKWSSMALGITGILLGWTPFFKDKLNTETNKQLNKFIDENK